MKVNTFYKKNNIGSKHGRKIIKQIYDLDKDFLERNFPIGNLPEHNDFIDMEI